MILIIELSLVAYNVRPSFCYLFFEINCTHGISNFYTIVIILLYKDAEKMCVI